MQPNKQAAEKIKLDWVKQAQESKVPQLMKMAVMIRLIEPVFRRGTTAPYRPGKWRESTII